MEELKKEIERCEELLKFYEEIPEGMFGAGMIRVALTRAKLAKTPEEIKLAVDDLKDCEG